MTELRFEKIEEYIFAPFNTFVYVDEDRLRFEGSYEVRKKLVDELNRRTIPLGRDNLYLEWCLEDSEDFKLYLLVGTIFTLNGALRTQRTSSYQKVFSALQELRIPL